MQHSGDLETTATDAPHLRRGRRSRGDLDPSVHNGAHIAAGMIFDLDLLPVNYPPAITKLVRQKLKCRLVGESANNILAGKCALEGPGVQGIVAERVGFEPTKGSHPCRFSRPVHSTALPPLRIAGKYPRKGASVNRRLAGRPLFSFVSGFNVVAFRITGW